MIRYLREGRRAWPVIPVGRWRVLDVGCGSGDALDRAGIDGLAVGIDINLGVLRSGHVGFPRCCFCCANGEAMPFGRGSFDAVLSRVALPYMDIPKALSEIARVLRPGGHVWFAFHRPSFVWSNLIEDSRALNLKGVLFRCYVLLNGLALHLFSRNFRYPLNRSRCESFQSERAVRRTLAAAGFEDIEIANGVPFVVTANVL